MKTMLISVLLTILFGGCRKNAAIGPADLLYKRWHLDRVKRIGDSAWISYDTDGYYDTEYRLDGTLIHRKDGVNKPTSCCEAGRYERSGNTIQYSDFVTCPSPANVLPCVPNQKANITALEENLLELNDGQRIAQYNTVQ